MKRFALVMTVVAATGCPDWEQERIDRCRALDASVGACEGVGGGGATGGGATGGGGEATGGGGGEPTGGGGGGPTGGGGATMRDFNLFAAISPVSINGVFGGSASMRRPVLIGEVARTQVVFVVEYGNALPDGGSPSIALWRSTDSAQPSGVAPQEWCASAASDRETKVGITIRAGTNKLSVDDVDAVNLDNKTYPMLRCAEALAAYQRADGGISFLGIVRNGNVLSVERSSCGVPCGVESSFDIMVPNPIVGETVTDEKQNVWISSLGGVATDQLYLAQVPFEGTTSPVPRRVADAGALVKLELSSSGTNVHGAWMAGRELTIATLSTDGGADQTRQWQFSEPVDLVDLVESARSVVAVLDYQNGRVALLVLRDGTDTFYRLNAPTYQFRARVAHLGTRLRIAGQCDGGMSCMVNRNPLMTFGALPDGGVW